MVRLSLCCFAAWLCGPGLGCAQAPDPAGETNPQRVTLFFTGRPVSPPPPAAPPVPPPAPALTVEAPAPPPPASAPDGSQRTVRYMTEAEWAAFRARLEAQDASN